jgi:histidyl-tRNA synthetase
MTPSVSRLVAGQRQELAYPLRLFNIGARWRYERPQKGRYREFYQLDVDMFGVENLNAELEMIQLADAIMKRFGASPDMYEIRLNSRKLLNQIIEESGPKADVNQVIGLIDHYDKLSSADFAAGLAELVENPTVLSGFLDSGAMSQELSELASKCEKLGIEVKFVPSLARGFDYYTDIVFEVFDLDPTNNRSMFGGGRYDGLVGLFGVEPVPTIGFAMGDAMLGEFLTAHNLLPKFESETDLYVALAGDIDAAAVISELRANLNVAVDFSGRKLDKQIKSASKKAIKWLLVIGENELASGRYNLKNLQTGEAFEVEVAAIPNRVRS